MNLNLSLKKELMRWEKIKNLIKIKNEFFTKNLTSGDVYGEKIKNFDNQEYRHWSPKNSKLANMLKKGFDPNIPIHSDVLYLGAATGTTASHLSDICENGEIYCVEISEKSLKEFLNRCSDRKNLFPILTDARKPRKYSKYIKQVNFLYQDVTQKEQAKIFQKNAEFFLKDGGKGILIIKAKSIDINKPTSEVVREEIEELDNFEIKSKLKLEPFHKDHIALFLRYQG